MDIAIASGAIVFLLLFIFLYHDGSANLVDYWALRAHRWAVARRKHQRIRAAELNRQWQFSSDREAKGADRTAIQDPAKPGLFSLLFTKSLDCCKMVIVRIRTKENTWTSEDRKG
jgi:hypothetical protein